MVYLHDALKMEYTSSQFYEVKTLLTQRMKLRISKITIGDVRRCLHTLYEACDTHVQRRSHGQQVHSHDLHRGR